jgi:beta-N-acetylhexosaminidase
LLISTFVFFIVKNSITTNIVSNQVKEYESTNGNKNSEELLDELVLNAAKGKVLKEDIIAGKTMLKEITEQFGSPDQQNTLEQVTYLTFNKEAFTIGTDDQGRIVEVRSYAPELNVIHYDEIIEKLREPNSIRYFKNKEVDQIILIYDLKQSYQLKFILPRPTDEIPNPTLHHTSVLYIMKNNTALDVEELLNKMTLKEKIGQMIFSGFYGSNYSNELNELIQQYKIGGFIFYSENIVSKNQTVNLINKIKIKNQNNKLPIFLGTDQEGGRITRLPGNLGKLPTNEQIGKRYNPEFSYQIGQILGEELNIFGFNMDFAPVLDVNSNPNNPVIGDRSFSNNPTIVSDLGIETMRGIQSRNVIPVVKHFPGHGDTTVDSHLELPVVDKTYDELNKLELIPFKQAINENADVLMITHILLPKIDPNFPSSISQNMISDILRKKLDFNSVVMTDDMTMAAIEKNYDLRVASVKSILAGSDIIMIAHDPNKVKSVFNAIQEAVKNGTIAETRIDESVKRIIELKQKYKMNNQPVRDLDTKNLIEKTNQLLK